MFRGLPCLQSIQCVHNCNAVVLETFPSQTVRLEILSMNRLYRNLAQETKLSQMNKASEALRGQQTNTLILLPISTIYYTISSKWNFMETVQVEWCEVNISVLTLVQSSCYSKGFLNWIALHCIVFQCHKWAFFTNLHFWSLLLRFFLDSVNDCWQYMLSRVWTNSTTFISSADK